LRISLADGAEGIKQGFDNASAWPSTMGDKWPNEFGNKVNAVTVPVLTN